MSIPTTDPQTYTMLSNGTFRTTDGKESYQLTAGTVIPMALAIRMGLPGAGYVSISPFDSVEEQRIIDLARLSGGVKEYWVSTAITTNLTAGPHDTDLVLPVKAFVYDILVDTTIAEVTGANKTISVGLKDQSGNEFANAVDVSMIQIQRPQATLAQQSNENYFSSTTRGFVFTPGFLAGSNVAGDVGTNYEKPVNMQSRSVRTVTISPGSNFSQFRGAIYFKVVEIV